jgi:hypothetical protein
LGLNQRPIPCQFNTGSYCTLQANNSSDNYDTAAYWSVHPVTPIAVCVVGMRLGAYRRPAVVTARYSRSLPTCTGRYSRSLLGMDRSLLSFATRRFGAQVHLGDARQASRPELVDPPGRGKSKRDAQSATGEHAAVNRANGSSAGGSGAPRMAWGGTRRSAPPTQFFENDATSGPSRRGYASAPLTPIIASRRPVGERASGSNTPAADETRVPALASEGPFASKDIDFCGDRRVIGFCAARLRGTARIASLDESTPTTTSSRVRAICPMEDMAPGPRDPRVRSRFDR